MNTRNKENKIARLSLGILLFFLFFYSTASSQSKPRVEKKTPSSVIYAAMSPTNTIVWLGADQGIFNEFGLDVKVIYARGAAPVQALVNNSVEFGVMGPAAITATIEGSDLVLVTAVSNFMVMSFWTKKDSPLKTLADLKRKAIAVSYPNSTTHTIARVALKTVGLTDKDVRYLYVGGILETFAALEKGLADAAVSSPPRPQFRELVGLSKEKIPFMFGAITVKRGFLENRRQVVQDFIKAYIKGIKIARENPTLAVNAIMKHLNVNQEWAYAAYKDFVNVWEQIPYVRQDSVQAVLDHYPKEVGKNIKAESFIDNSIIKELDNSGFIKSLYGN